MLLPFRLVTVVPVQLKVLFVKGNAESLYYNRNDETQKLETITKEIASDIEFTFENNEVIQTKYFKETEGKTYPPSQFPEEDKKFRGFIWREDEQPKKMEDIFIKDKRVARKPKKKLQEVENAKAILNKEFDKKRKKKSKLDLEEE